ncbi:MAG: glutamine-hydrolyzing carbamoyl-phosphate synthase small subunit [Gammaproteobacteria bacterium]|nr:glutamine-hydrolyzing carbamoyl-phosphate synthase small subunit [Gammaproteobacteria bacterium]
MHKSAYLVLADGQLFEGYSIGAPGVGLGELVFHTAMTGYQEILTDPSYAKQIVMLTAPHIGNTGWNTEDMESSKIWASGLVARDVVNGALHYRSQTSLTQWLTSNGIPGIAGLDTRQLTLYLRDVGAVGACLTTDENGIETARRLASSYEGMAGQELASQVSCQTKYVWEGGQEQWAITRSPLQHHVVAYDFGVKHTMLKMLYDRGCYVTVVPAKTSAAEVLALNPDGLFLSNGPGDPGACDYAIEATKQLLNTGIPLFGICLGFQILSLALGAKSLKMRFGHHGANHPVADVTDASRIYITSQNHGFAIDEATLPSCLEVTHRSLFDQSLQGVKHKQLPVFGFQGHPEASPGPHDVGCLFDRFIAMMQMKNNNKE